MELIQSISEAKGLRTKFNLIFLTCSSGEDFLFFSYGSAGLGNLVTAYIGGLMTDEDIKIINFYEVKISHCVRFFRNPVYWYIRSSFTIYNKKNNLMRALHANPNQADPKLSYLDADLGVLYLSTHLVEIDNFYFDNFALLDRGKLKLRLFDAFGLHFDEPKIVESVSYKVGIHIRRGDFIRPSMINPAGQANVQFPLIDFVRGIKKILNEYNCCQITIFSDEALTSTEKKLLCNVVEGKKGITLEFDRGHNAASTMNKMIKVDILLISNSTFSFWAGALSGKPTFYFGENAPYAGQRFLDYFLSVDAL